MTDIIIIIIIIILSKWPLAAMVSWHLLLLLLSLGTNLYCKQKKVIIILLLFLLLFLLSLLLFVCFVCWLQLDSSMALCNVEQFINPMCYLYQYFGPQWVIFQDIKLAFGLSS